MKSGKITQKLNEYKVRQREIEIERKRKSEGEGIREGEVKGQKEKIVE